MSWNPLQDLMVLQDRMNRLFEDATQKRARGHRRSTVKEETDDQLERADWTPVADIYETESEYTVAVDLPGIDRSSLDISIDDDQLIIRGRRSLEPPRGLRSERQGGKFLRTFTLSKSVDQNDIRADYQDGVLQVHLPRRKNDNQRVQIKIS